LSVIKSFRVRLPSLLPPFCQAAAHQPRLQLPQTASSATLLEMTQLTTGAGGPSLSATSGVTIQGASVGANGSWAPGGAYTLSASGTELTCYVPYPSAVLIHVP